MRVVRPILDVDLHARAQPARVLVEGRLEPARPQAAAAQPRGRERVHLGEQRRARRGPARRAARAAASCRGLRIGRCPRASPCRRSSAPSTGSARWGSGSPRCARPAASRSRAPRAASSPPSVTTWHSTSSRSVATNQRASSPMVRPWRIGSAPAPTKLSQPARSVSPSTGRPAGFGRSSTHTALPSARGLLEHVAQRRDEGIDAAAEVLQVDQQHVEAVHHRRRRPAHRAVEAEHRNAVHRIGVSPPTRPCCPACRRAARAAARRRRSP